MTKIRNLIVEMLTNMVPNPESIADICCRTDKKVLVVQTPRGSSLVFVYSEKNPTEATGVRQSDYPDFGYIHDYAVIFDEAGFKLLAVGAGSPDAEDPTTCMQVSIWSSSSLVSMVLFAALLRVWKKAKFDERVVTATINSLVGKYEAHEEGVVTSSYPFKVYQVKPSMESVDVSGEIDVFTSEVVVGEEPRLRAVYTSIINHIESIRQSLLLNSQRVRARLNRGDFDVNNFTPDNVFDHIKTS